MSEGFDLVALTRRVAELPSLPQAVVEVMQALRSSDLSANRSIALIETDQALAARTLRLANSAFYGVPGRVASIGDAVRMLGLRTVAAVLTAASLHGTLQVADCPGFCFESYWRHAIGCALAARAMAPLAGLDADEAFLAGLMHDIGQLVLAAYAPQAASRAIALARDTDQCAAAAEVAVLGVAHPHIGAMVAKHWCYPPSITQAIALHHAPENASAGQRVSLSGLVHVADAITHGLDLNDDSHEAVPAIAPNVWQALGMGHSEVLKIFAITEQGTREMSDVLNGAG